MSRTGTSLTATALTPNNITREPNNHNNKNKPSSLKNTNDSNHKGTLHLVQHSLAGFVQCLQILQVNMRILGLLDYWL